MTLIPRALGALLTSALAVSLVAAGPAHAQAAAPVGSPAGHGATWLSGQLTNGLVHNPNFGGFDDYGLTIDTVFALRAVGGHPSVVRQARTALAQNVGSYTGTGGEKFSGATAKLLVLAEVTGAAPRSFGGTNLVQKLNGLVTESGPAKGRIADRSQFGDFANTIGQILAVRGLTTAGSGQAGPAQRFLLQQQCAQGFFRLDFSKPKAAHQGCGKNSAPDPDATSYAVVQLWKTSKNRPTLRASLEHAVAWLATKQRKGGAFVGGTSTATPNTNSTGLAAWALGLAHRCRAAKAAATWVAGFQLGAQAPGSALRGQRGAIAYDRAGLKAGTRDGITPEAQDQWRRATSQAAPGLLFRHGC
jgi:hypothetical protein